MNMQENYRLIEALESAGWTAQEIVNLIKYVESGEQQYKPRKQPPILEMKGVEQDADGKGIQSH